MQGEYLSKFQRALLAAYVVNGAEWLDDHAPAGWADLLLGYLPGIDISDASACIVGTLVKTRFFDGVNHTVNPECAGTTFSGFLERYGLYHTQAQHGFNSPSSEPDSAFGLEWRDSQVWSVLMECWRHEIITRVTPVSVAGAIGRMEGKLVDLRRVAGEKETVYGQQSEACNELQKERNTLCAEVHRLRGVKDEFAQAAADAETDVERAQKALNKFDARFENAESAKYDAREEYQTAMQQLREAEDAKQQLESHHARAGLAQWLTLDPEPEV